MPRGSGLICMHWLNVMRKCHVPFRRIAGGGHTLHHGPEDVLRLFIWPWLLFVSPQRWAWVPLCISHGLPTKSYSCLWKYNACAWARVCECPCMCLCERGYGYEFRLTFSHFRAKNHAVLFILILGLVSKWKILLLKGKVIKSAPAAA